MTLEQLEHDHPGWVWSVRTDRFGYLRYEGDYLGRSVSVYTGWLGQVFVRDTVGGVHTYEEWSRNA